MTAWQKLKLEHPDEVPHSLDNTCRICPDMYGYLDPLPVDKCLGDSCHECWNREIPEEKKKTLNDMREEVGLPRILDSGARQEFGTGAVRDIQEGKGRCDLMPLDILAQLMNDGILRSIALFQYEGNVAYLFTALDMFSAHWDDGMTKAGQYDIIIQRQSTMALEVAIHFEEGAKKYGENNWQKGIPVKRYIDSAVRHYLKFLRGDKDEPHDRAFCWNIMCAIWTCKHKPELNDYHDVDKSIKAAEHVIKTCDDALKRIEAVKVPAHLYAEDNE